MLALAVIPMVGLAADAGLGTGPQAILVYAVTAFFLPAAVLSAASPTVVKLQLHDLGETGSVVGRYSAIGTGGAIVGSFATGFVLVSAIPTRPIVIGVGVVLIAAGIVAAATLGRSRPSGLTGLALVIAACAVLLAIVAPNPCQRESAYFCISVETVSADDSERLLRMDTLRHAYVDLDDPTVLEFAYTQLLGDVVGGHRTCARAHRRPAHRGRRLHPAALHRSHQTRLAQPRAGAGPAGAAGGTRGAWARHVRGSHGRDR